MKFNEIQAKLDVMKSNLRAPDPLPQATFDEFAADSRNLPAPLHLLQTSI